MIAVIAASKVIDLAVSAAALLAVAIEAGQIDDG